MHINEVHNFLIEAIFFNSQCYKDDDEKGLGTLQHNNLESVSNW